jgi:hypothetical protein
MLGFGGVEWIQLAQVIDWWRQFGLWCRGVNYKLFLNVDDKSDFEPTF